MFETSPEGSDSSDVAQSSDASSVVTSSESSDVTLSSLPSTDAYGDVSQDSVASEPQAAQHDGCLYDLTFDNVNQKVHVRHHSRGQKTGMLNMVQAYASRDRIPCLHLNDDMPPASAIRDMPVEMFLPSAPEEDLCREELSIMIKRILVENLSCFKDAIDRVPKHIPHLYSRESSMPSNIVSSGLPSIN